MTEARRRGPSVRARVMIGLVSLMLMAFVIAGGTLYAAQRSATDDRIDRALRTTVDRFTTLATPGATTPEDSSPSATTATTGTTGTVGTPGTQAPGSAPAALSGERLLYATMQQTLPAHNEGMLAIVNGKTRWTAPDQVELRLEDDPQFLAWATSDEPGQEITLTMVRTDRADYRVASIPVVAREGRQTARLLYAFDHSAERRVVDGTFALYAAVGLAALALSALVGWFVIGHLLRPVRLLRETARGISESDLSQRIEVVGRDDLAELTVTVNAMLDRVEGAVTSQKQLLDDAGHELRTPITVVQGHLELMDPDDPGDVRLARDVTLDELDRMTFLVNDLVTLAQSGAEGFVRLTPCDVGELLDDVLGKAATLGERSWSLSARPEVVAVLDPRRITQALLQLASNAVRYSAPGSAVSIGGAVSVDGPASTLGVPAGDGDVIAGHGGAVLRLWVRDEGVGIAEQDRARVFERFGRASGAQRADGAGLGLSIVAAIAQAHGGDVQLQSVPGAGSTFVLVLPMGSAPELHGPEDSDRSPLGPPVGDTTHKEDRA